MSKIKMTYQNLKKDTARENYKKEFIRRLIKYSLEVIRLADKLKEQKISYSIIDQLIRSATSIGANVIEAKSASSKKDYIKYFEIALKSSNETKYWLFIIKEIQKDKESNKAEDLLKETIEISRILGASILTLKRKR